MPPAFTTTHHRQRHGTSRRPPPSSSIQKQHPMACVNGSPLHAWNHLAQVRGRSQGSHSLCWHQHKEWRGSGNCGPLSGFVWVKGCRAGMTPRTEGSPSIPARPHPSKNTGDFKSNEPFVPGLKPRLRLLPLASGIPSLRKFAPGPPSCWAGRRILLRDSMPT